jgi:hypothetical protein
MTDFEAHRGDYQGWRESYRRSFLNSLIAIMKSTPTLGLGVAIDLEAFSGLEPTAKAELLDHTAYSLAVTVAVRLISDQANPSDSVAYVLDVANRRSGKARIRREMDFILANAAIPMHAGLRIDSVAWASSLAAPELQAADVYVYEYTKDVARRLERPFAPRTMRYPAARLTDGTGARQLSLVMDKTRLEELVQNIRDGGGLVS